MTPAEWLLSRYDREARRAAFGPWPRDWRRTRTDRGSGFDRRLFELIDDHPDDACVLSESSGECIWWLSDFGCDFGCAVGESGEGMEAA